MHAIATTTNRTKLPHVFVNEAIEFGLTEKLGAAETSKAKSSTTLAQARPIEAWLLCNLWTIGRLGAAMHVVSRGVPTARAARASTRSTALAARGGADPVAAWATRIAATGWIVVPLAPIEFTIATRTPGAANASAQPPYSPNQAFATSLPCTARATAAISAAARIATAAGRFTTTARLASAARLSSTASVATAIGTRAGVQPKSLLAAIAAAAVNLAGVAGAAAKRPASGPATIAAACAATTLPTSNTA